MEADIKEDNILSKIKLESFDGHSIQCGECQEQFTDKQILNVHKAVHDPKKYCNLCEKKFNSIEIFVDHISNHLNEIFKCDICKDVLFSKKLFNLHINNHKDRAFHCEHCSKSFKTRKELSVHLRVHTNERPYNCSRCKKSFKQTSALKTHENTHTEDKQFICEICNGTFSTASSLRRHVKRIHNKGKTIPCANCNEIFYNRDAYAQHRRENHPETLYNRSCSVCQKIFTSKKLYYEHSKAQHNDRGAAHNCFLCGKCIIGSYNFREHQKYHFGMTEEEYSHCEKTNLFTCKQCGIVKRNIRGLRNHMQCHLSKDLRCEICDEGSFSFPRLKLHKYYQHVPVTCQICQESFVGHRRFDNHRYSKHPQISMKTYKCTVCGKLFKFRKSLFKHYRGHALVKCLKCKLCNKKLLSFHLLLRHLQLKHKTSDCAINVDSEELLKDIGLLTNTVRQYICHICKASFKLKRGLVNHVKVHSRESFKCTNCKMNFSAYRNWENHVKNKICKKYMALALKKDLNDLKCAICKKAVCDLKGLTDHMKTHTNKHRYDCKICNVVFRRLHSLQRHMTGKHPDVDIYNCAKCKMSFKYFSDYVKHGHKKMIEKQVEYVEVKQEIVDEEQIKEICIKREPVEV